MTRRAAHAVAWTVFAIAALALIAMPTSGYDWMAQMDPTIVPGSIEDSDNRWPVIAVIALMVALAAQAVALQTAAGRTVRILSVSSMVAAIAIWLARFII